MTVVEILTYVAAGISILGAISSTISVRKVEEALDVIKKRDH